MGKQWVFRACKRQSLKTLEHKSGPAPIVALRHLAPISICMDTCWFGTHIYDYGSEPVSSGKKIYWTILVRNSDFMRTTRSQSGSETHFSELFGFGSVKLYPWRPLVSRHLAESCAASFITQHDLLDGRSVMVGEANPWKDTLTSTGLKMAPWLLLGIRMESMDPLLGSTLVLWHLLFLLVHKRWRNLFYWLANTLFEPTRTCYDPSTRWPLSCVRLALSGSSSDCPWSQLCSGPDLGGHPSSLEASPDVVQNECISY